MPPSTIFKTFFLLFFYWPSGIGLILATKYNFLLIFLLKKNLSGNIGPAQRAGSEDQSNEQRFDFQSRLHSYLFLTDRIEATRVLLRPGTLLRLLWWEEEGGRICAKESWSIWSKERACQAGFNCWATCRIQLAGNQACAPSTSTSTCTIFCGITWCYRLRHFWWHSVIAGCPRPSASVTVVAARPSSGWNAVTHVSV